MFFLGIAIGLGQVVFFDYLGKYDYLAFAPTVLALVLIWWGISKMRNPNVGYAYG